MLTRLPEGTKTGNPYHEILNGTFVVDLHTFADTRGDLAELYRTEWFNEEVRQINYTRNEPGTMRGAHFHLQRNEHIIIASGSALFGLHDARPGSPTEGKSAMLNLSADKLQMIYVPTGVVHSIYSPTENIMLVGQTSYYQRADEYDCFYNDPDLNFSWPITDVSKLVISQRDKTAGSLTKARTAIPNWQPASRKLPTELGVAPV